MSCSKYTLTNTGTTVINFNYRRCDDAMWQYQVELYPNQTKNIWLMDNTYSIAPLYVGEVVLINEGVFPPVYPTPTATPTPTVTPSNTASQTPTPSVTASQTQTPTTTPTQTGTPNVTPSPTATVGATPTATETQTPTPTQTNTGTPNVTPTSTTTPTTTITASPTETETPTPTPTNTGTSAVTPTPTNTGTPAVTPTPSTTIGATPTSTETQTPTPTETPTNTPTNTQTGTPDVTTTPTNTPTQTQTGTPDVTSTPTNTSTPTSTSTLSNVFIGNGDAFNTAQITAITINSVAISGPVSGYSSLPVIYPQDTLYTTTEINGNYDITVSISRPFPSGDLSLYVEDSNLNIECVTVTGSGDYTVNNVYIVAGGGIGISINNTPCPTPTPTVTPTNTETPTNTPTNTETPTNTPTQTTTHTPTPTVTPTPAFRVLYLGGTDASTEASDIQTYLTNTGYSMTYSAVTLDTSYDGSNGITPSEYDVVLLYTPLETSGGTYSATLGTAMSNYVTSGGSLVTGANLWRTYPSGFNHSGLTAFNANGNSGTNAASAGFIVQSVSNSILSGVSQTFSSTIRYNGLATFPGSQLSVSSGSRLYSIWAGGGAVQVNQLAYKRVGNSRLVSFNGYSTDLANFGSTGNLTKIYGNSILFALGFLPEPTSFITVRNDDTTGSAVITGITISGLTGVQPVGLPISGDTLPMSGGGFNTGFTTTEWGSSCTVSVGVDFQTPLPSGSFFISMVDSNNFFNISYTQTGGVFTINGYIGNNVSFPSQRASIAIGYEP